MFSRRSFIRSSGFLFALPYLAQGEQGKTNEDNIIIGGGMYQSLDKNQQANKHFVISTVKLDTLSLSTQVTPFLPHGFHRNPRDTKTLAVFEKKGPGALIFDIAEGTVVRHIPAQTGRYFYGHGAYTADGKLLLSTETDLASREGIIGVRDAKTMAYLGKFPSYGQEPHECKLIDGGQTLVVTNGGGPLQGQLPNVAYIDVASQRLLEKVPLTSTKVNTGHMAVGDKGELIVISAPRKGMSKQDLGGVSIRSKSARLQTQQSPLAITQKMFGEALSVVIHNKHSIAAVTHPTGNMLTFWSLEHGAFLAALPLKSPRGVTLTKDETHFIVSYGHKANLIKIPVATLQVDKKTMVASTYLTGSHIYNWSRAMSELAYPGPQV